MLADELDYVVGVDTHRDEHVLACCCRACWCGGREAGGAGEHAFFNDTLPSYHADAAADSWRRMLAFFDEHVKGSATNPYEPG